jgi:hypothetical protein
MELYWLFACCYYHPPGGWNDYQGSFESEEDAIKYLYTNKYGYNFAHIVKDMKIVLNLTRGHRWGEYEEKYIGKWFEEDENGNVTKVY